ncbi:hypothetical protein CHGG_04218 [Chaetomium globosum CBS 148.51]|uniref:SNF2 N-terminal domain-containing protein n=1 Tax=Chaetomium globosum (strain ATCC 6205 / CBS 148.51 / DSM 1962 / NBRC 6347 / NRRL 1970) TaxID=306901 RepID=Q2H1X8_CHAGB|nr:uncharacterized protein CHGG_04218 [Chaetomium globosum CBS 148.51]EAQ87599.1 hypothetical protein CHGG_04218 [Chaetomium globosum CBS 148.51]
MQPAGPTPDLFSGILLDPNVGSQMSLINLDETDYNLASALTEWGDNMALPDLYPPQSTPISYQEISYSPSVVPNSIQSTGQSAISTDDEETICYGMLHDVDVKLVGEMRTTDANLGESEAGYRRFELCEQQDHIILCFHNDGKEFGYLRSGVGKTLAPLLAKPYVEFEPITLTSNLKLAKPAEAIVKVDINVYGPRRAADEVGNALSRGKLWLQKSGHARREVAYDNPHFLPLKVHGIQMQAVQPVSQIVKDGLVKKKHREERMRKMVEEVYKSLDNTRHLDVVEGGNRITRKLLKYRHRITKARAKQDTQPDERGGGILADEMGMGKSLSILALIANTLDDGKNEWAQQQNRRCRRQGGRLRHSPLYRLLFVTLLPLNRSPIRPAALHDSSDDDIAVPKPVLQHLKHLDSLPLHCMPLGAQSKPSNAEGPLAVSCHGWNSENVKGHLRQLWELSLITDPPFNRIDVAPDLHVVVPVNLVLVTIFIGTDSAVDEGLIGRNGLPAKRPSDFPDMQPAGPTPDLFSGILLDPNVGSQMSLINLDETDYNLASALTEWGDNMALPDLYPPQSTPISYQEISYSPSVVPNSIQSTGQSAISTDDEETICYGMLHDVDVKLVGEMRTTDANLGESEAGYRRFELCEQQDHIILCFHNDGKEFGYLRSGVGKTLAPLLAKPYVEFEPITLTSNLKLAKPAEAIVKVDINVYGPRRAADEVGNALSRGKLWLQKSGHARREVAYDNPHFLPLKVHGIQMQAVQPVSQIVKDGLVKKKHREERMRKMVEEVYKSLDNTRHLDVVEGGNRITRKLLKYRHRITKARAKQDTQPDERGGGILADEMGMGKSLSILALIANTLDDGKNEWAQQQTDGAEGKEALRHSRSTLVVVPSAQRCSQISQIRQTLLI